MSIRSTNQALDSNFTGDREEEESNEGSDSKEVVNNTTIKLWKYVQALMGEQVRDATMQTGGPGAHKGKALKKKGATAIEAMVRMHMVMPVVEGMMLHPYFCDLLLNYTV